MTKKKPLESILEQQSGEYDMTLFLYIILHLPYKLLYITTTKGVNLPYLKMGVFIVS